MQELPLKSMYCHNQIACRFLYSPSKNQPLIMTIPGGPCLSGKYLDSFLIKLASQLQVNVGIFDLPNHGDSVISSDNLPLSYQNCLELLDQALIEISVEYDKVILFGQSFGARLAFDLAATTTDVKIAGLFLTGFPYMFKMSEKLLNDIGMLDLEKDQDDVNTGKVLTNNWAKILKLYTYAPLQVEEFNALVSNLKFVGNESILSGSPSIEKYATLFADNSFDIAVAIVQGDVDGVVPDGNLARLKSIIPSAQFYEIANCGHFPMIENQEATLNAFSQLISRIS
jgi:pimeloyl-ACP methyl ester carboxylesterase